MRCCVVALTLFVLISIAAARAAAAPVVHTMPESGIRLSIKPVYDVTPMNGFFPLRITLDNRSGRARTWRLRATQNGSRSDWGSSVFTRELSVPDQTEQTFEVYVPILATSRRASAWANHNIQIALSGYGIRTASLQAYGSRRPKSLPYVAMSETLHLRSWPVFNKSLEKQKIYLYGSKISPDNMPRQWRGYAGVWRLLISAEEWDGLPPEARRAVVDWVLMGGELHLFHRHQLPHGNRDYGGFRFEGLGAARQAQQAMGMGHVALHIWDGVELPSAYERVLTIGGQYSARATHYEGLEQAGTQRTWPFLQHMPTRRFTLGFLWVLGLFLLGYFILVGPFNIWRSAKRGQRLQLFFTTPALALICSALLCVLLAMHAGFGAWGYRATGVYLLPKQPKAMVMQEQISKTAFMFQTGFDAPRDAFLTPVSLPETPRKINPVYRTVVGSAAAGQFTGDWFANNAVQAHFAIALQPTRAAVTFAPDHTLRSSINAVLSEIYVRDENGRYWRGREVAAGAQAKLQPVSKVAYNRWRRKAIEAQTGLQLQRALHLIEDRSGVFVAVAQRAPDFTIDTLAGVNWKSQTVVIFGHLPSATPVTRDGALILQAAGHQP